MDMENEQLLERLRELRAEHVRLETRTTENRECLTRTINVLLTVLKGDESIRDEIDSISEAVGSSDRQALAVISKSVDRLRSKVVRDELAKTPADDPENDLDTVTRRFETLNKLLRHVMRTLLNDFYPLSEELAVKAEKLRKAAEKDPSDSEFRIATVAFLDYVEALRGKIAEDFDVVTTAFTKLLGQIKDLEKSVTLEFTGGRNTKEVTQLETQINEQVESLVNSLNVAATVNDIRNVLSQRIDNIRAAIVAWRKKETDKAARIERSMAVMKGRIAEAESDASNMSKKADELRLRAMRDGMTGLFNRTALDMRLHIAVEEFDKAGKQFTLMIFDIDKFKDINDAFGHIAGDRVIIKVAECLQNAFRKGDFIARYGGDEFAAIFEEIDTAGTRDRVERFRDGLARWEFNSESRGRVDVTVSAGSASPSKGDTPQTLLNRADKAMYDDKNLRYSS